MRPTPAPPGGAWNDIQLKVRGAVHIDPGLRVTTLAPSSATAPEPTSTPLAPLPACFTAVNTGDGASARGVSHLYRVTVIFEIMRRPH